MGRTRTARDHGAATLLACLLLACGEPQPRADTPAGPSTPQPAQNETDPRMIQELPGVLALEVVDDGAVRFTAPENQVLDLLRDGGLHDLRHHVQADTGDLVPTPGAPPPHELTVKVGESCSLGQHTTHRYQVLRINADGIDIHHTGHNRGGEPLDEVLRVTPYGPQQGPFHSCAGLPEDQRLDFRNTELDAPAWVAMRWEDTEWWPAATVPMPRHHSSRLDFTNIGEFSALPSQRGQTLVFHLRLRARDIQCYEQRRCSVSYTADLTAVCRPAPARP